MSFRPMSFRFRFLIAIAGLLMLSGMVTTINAQEQVNDGTDSQAETVDAETQARYDKFSETLSGAKFVGNFTVLGKENSDLTPEEYHIKSVQKMDKGDMWLFTARIKYGEHDVSIPMPLEVKWAGGTPIITVSDFTFMGVGPFSSRVIVYNGKYAGTWSHGDVGGHLFGTIEPSAAEGVDVEKSRREMDAKKEGEKFVTPPKSGSSKDN